jgi:hypothetical protein
MAGASARIVGFKIKITTTTITIDVRTSKGVFDENVDLPELRVSEFILSNKGFELTFVSQVFRLEGRRSTKTDSLPGWPQSPELRKALLDTR